MKSYRRYAPERMYKAMSFDRMAKDDQRLRQEVEDLLTKVDAADAADDEAEGAYDPEEEIRLREEKLATMEAARDRKRARRTPSRT